MNFVVQKNKWTTVQTNEHNERSHYKNKIYTYFILLVRLFSRSIVDVTSMSSKSRIKMEESTRVKERERERRKTCATVKTD